MTAQFQQDFLTFAGDDVFPVFTVRDSAGAAVDISTVSQITWYCQSTGDGGALITKTKSAGQIAFVTNGTDGKFEVTIGKTDTTGLSGFYQHVASITDALGNITTVTVGRMRVGLRPNWTYNAAQIATVPLFQVRRWLGDVIENDQQMNDSEILYALSQRSSPIGAAADCAKQLAAQYSRKVDTTVPGGISTNYSVQAEHYRLLAIELEQLARSRGSGVTPYMGGVSVAEKIAVEANSDRVAPSFNIGMTDNLIPIPAGGNQMPPNPSQGGAT